MQLHLLIFQASHEILGGRRISVAKGELEAKCSMEKEEGHDSTSQDPMNIT